MRKLTLIILLALTQPNLYAQSDFLYKVGVVDSIGSSVLNEQRKIYVQLPGSYDPKSDRKYPVAYILDGEVFLPTLVDAHSYYSGGFFPEMILVGITNNKHRTRDLTPTEIKTKYGMPFNDESGGGANFLKFISDELIPYIENKYPVTQYRTLIGHSYGGLFTIYTLVNQPNLFANYLAIDPSLDWDNQIIIHQAKKAFTTHSYKGKSLYVSLSGQLHMQNPQVTIDNVMQDTTDYTLFPRSNIAFSYIINENKSIGLTFDWEFFPQDLHGTVAFPSIRNGLLFLFDWFQMEKTEKFNTPETPREELYDLIRYRETKLQSHFGYNVAPYPEDLINMSGYMSMNMEQPEKAKMFFELGIEYYPNSPNAYDSMADYYISQNDTTKVLELVKKAFELSGDNYYRDRIKKIKRGK